MLSKNEFLQKYQRQAQVLYFLIYFIPFFLLKRLLFVEVVIVIKLIPIKYYCLRFKQSSFYTNNIICN
jgi:hypothetical protein